MTGPPFGGSSDPYEVLGVPTLASNEEIHRAYRAVALRDHPDTNPGDPQAAIRFAHATQAYELLTDDARRRAYDLARAALRGPRAARSAPGPTGNTTVRGPDARPSHRPRTPSGPGADRNVDRAQADEFAVLKLFVKAAVVVAVVFVILLVVAAMNPAPVCGPGVDPGFCRTATPSVPPNG